MREALGLAPKCSTRPQGNRLDKHEFSELVKRGSTAEDLGAGHAEAAQVQGVGFSRLHPVMIGKKTMEMDLITTETTQIGTKMKTSKPQTLLEVLRIFDFTWTFFFWI